MCTYSASGGKAASFTVLGFSTEICIFESAQQSGKRLPAVADAVLLAGIELGGGFSERGKIEQRVVAEAVGAARRARDLAAPQPLGDQRKGIFGMAHQDHDARVVRGSISRTIREQ